MAEPAPPPADADGGPGRVFTELTSVMFAELARHLLAEAARNRLGNRIAFRSPPRERGMSRTKKDNPDGSTTISVVIRGRNAHAVAADMIDGICHVAQIDHRHDAFSALWEVAASICDPLLDQDR